MSCDVVSCNVVSCDAVPCVVWCDICSVLCDAVSCDAVSRDVVPCDVSVLAVGRVTHLSQIRCQSSFNSIDLLRSRNDESRLGVDQNGDI